MRRIVLEKRLLLVSCLAVIPFVLRPSDHSKSTVEADPAWTAETDQASAFGALGVAGAGDVNGDGFDDVLVGAPSYTRDQNREGAAFLWLGSSGGLGPNGLPGNADWIGESNQAGTGLDGNVMYGYDVASAGDVNGDGFDDVIIGAPRYNGAERDAGQVFVYYGSAAGLPTTPSWMASVTPSFSLFGLSVASAGDINGDGYDDIIVGAPSCFQTGTELDGLCQMERTGQVFVWLGSATGLGPTGTAANADWAARTDQQVSLFGASVASAGDVNGDGFDDIIVGASWHSLGQFAEGAAFVWYGSAAGLGPNGMPANADWTAEGNTMGIFLGRSVSSAGDVNSDGFDDVLVGASGYDHPSVNEGGAFVWLGSAAGLGPNGNPANAAWQAESDQSGADGNGAIFGWSVASIKDFNSDGFDDILVGSPSFFDGEPSEGAAFAWFGGSSGLGDPGVPSNADWKDDADLSPAYFGYRVRAAGDVNGDGAQDLIVGAYGVAQPQSYEGRAYVYAGSEPALVSFREPLHKFDWWIPIGPCLDLSGGVPGFPFDPGMGSKNGCPPPPSCWVCMTSFAAGTQLDTIRTQPYFDAYRVIAPVLKRFAAAPRAQTTIDLRGVPFKPLATSLRQFRTRSPAARALRDSAVNSLERLRDPRRVSRDVGAQLAEVLNAMDLEARLPAIEPQSIKQSKRAKADLAVAQVAFADVTRGGTVTLRVEPGVPVLPPGWQPGSPVAHYVFEFNGQLSERGYALTSFDIRGMSFSGDRAAARVLEWDGKALTDVTTGRDVSRGIITARTRNLGTYIIVAPASAR